MGRPAGARRPAERGQTAVEYGLVAAVVFLLLIGVWVAMDLGRFVGTEHKGGGTAGAVREAAQESFGDATADTS